MEIVELTAEHLPLLRQAYSTMQTTFTDEELYTLPHLEQELLGNNDEKSMLCVVAKSGENVLGAALCKLSKRIPPAVQLLVLICVIA